jgi:hypothetical protein
MFCNELLISQPLYLGQLWLLGKQQPDATSVPLNGLYFCFLI